MAYSNRCFFFIFLGIGLLKSGMSALGITTVSQMWALGFGTVTGNAIVSSAPSSLIPTVLFANLPQAILSFLYLTYNGLFSCVLGAHEWSLFAKHARTLRVTSPQGQQRSTYYLQLPYYYALVSPFQISDETYTSASQCSDEFRTMYTFANGNHSHSSSSLAHSTG